MKKRMTKDKAKKILNWICAPAESLTAQDYSKLYTVNEVENAYRILLPKHYEASKKEMLEVENAYRILLPKHLVKKITHAYIKNFIRERVRIFMDILKGVKNG